MMDRAGILLSGLCLVHCLGLPFALALVPFLGSEHAHHVLLVAVALTAVLALGRGYVVHRRPAVLLAEVIGIALLAFAITLEGVAEPAVTSAGGVMMATAHLMNARARASCSCHV